MNTGHKSWTVTVDGAIFPTDGFAIANGVLYSGGEKLHAFDATSGEPIWTTSTAISRVATPVVANGVVYASDANAKIIAFDAATGHLKWSISYPNAGALDKPVLADGMIYVRNTFTLYAFDAATGQRRWSILDNGYSDPTVANGILYVSVKPGYMSAFDAATGRQKWIAPVGWYAVSTRVAVADGVVYFAAKDRMYALDAATGRQKWSVSVGIIALGRVVVSEGAVYVNGNKLYALDAASGRQKWSAPLLGFPPAVVDGVVYMNKEAKRGQLYALNAADGKEKWNVPGGDSTPVIVNGKAYSSNYLLGLNKSSLYAIPLDAMPFR